VRKMTESNLLQNPAQYAGGGPAATPGREQPKGWAGVRGVQGIIHTSGACTHAKKQYGTAPIRSLT